MTSSLCGASPCSDGVPGGSLGAVLETEMEREGGRTAVFLAFVVRSYGPFGSANSTLVTVHAGHAFVIESRPPAGDSLLRVCATDSFFELATRVENMRFAHDGEVMEPRLVAWSLRPDLGSRDT